MCKILVTGVPTLASVARLFCPPPSVKIASEAAANSTVVQYCRGPIDYLVMWIDYLIGLLYHPANGLRPLHPHNLRAP